MHENKNKPTLANFEGQDQVYFSKVASVKPKLGHEVENRETSKKSPSLKFKVGNKRSWVPPGTYQARALNIEKKVPFKDKPVLEFLFEIVSGDHKGVELRGFCNADYETFSENTKLYQWYSVVTGDQPKPGEELDMSVFFDKVLEGEVEEKISRKTKNKFSNVTKILKVVYEL